MSEILNNEKMQHPETPIIIIERDEGRMLRQSLAAGRGCNGC